MASISLDIPGLVRRGSSSSGVGRVRCPYHAPLCLEVPALRAFLTLCLLSIATLMTGTVAWAGEATTPGGHRVRWDGGLDDIGNRVVASLPRVRARVAVALGFPLRGGGAEIVVVSGYDRMRSEGGREVPEWAAGVCIGSQSRIVMRADLVDRDPLNSMVTTLRHEWVHLSWSRRAGANVRELPLWVEEGLAEDVGGGISIEAGFQLDAAAKFGRLIPFSQIESTWPEDARDASLAYKEGRSWVGYFRNKAKPGTLQRILADLADGKRNADTPGAGSHFQQLVFAETGATLSHWIAAWKIKVKEEADPWFHLLLRDFTGTIFFTLGVLSLGAFYFLRRRRKRQIAELDEDP